MLILRCHLFPWLILLTRINNKRNLKKCCIFNIIGSKLDYQGSETSSITGDNETFNSFSELMVHTPHHAYCRYDIIEAGTNNNIIRLTDSDRDGNQIWIAKKPPEIQRYTNSSWRTVSLTIGNVEHGIFCKRTISGPKRWFYQDSTSRRRDVQPLLDQKSLPKKSKQ
jgi:hypothetical protein